MILKRGWQVVLVLSCVGCAGELREPERFAFVYDKEDGGTQTDLDASSSVAGRSGGGGSGGGGRGAAGEPASEGPPSCVTELFENTCGGCHSAAADHVDLVSPGVEARLVDRESSSDDCSGRTYIATDGSSSLLIDKLMESPPCGQRMPVGPRLSTADTQCLTDWVDSLSDAN